MRASSDQRSEIRNQRSEAAQAGFTHCCGFAVNRMSYPVGAGLKCPPADRKQKLEIRRQMRYGQGFSKVTASQKQFVCSRRGGSLCPPAGKLDFVIGYGERQKLRFHNRHKIFSFRTLLGRAQKSSGFRHPFVRYADISPNRGITRPYNYRFYFFCAAAALCKIYLHHGKATAKDGRNG